MPQLAIALETAGIGSPVLFIHGLGGTSNVFGPQVAALSNHFICLRPDLPGAGRSPLPNFLSIETLVDSMHALVEKHVGNKPIHVIGHSMGTIIAQHLALRASAKIDSLFLIGPIHAPSDTARQAIRNRAALARNEGMVPISDAVVQSALSSYKRMHNPVLVAFVRELLMRQDPLGYAALCEALASAKPADLSKIQTPTMLVTGDEDATSPPQAVEQMANQLPRAQMRVFEKCGHWATLECPDQVTAALMSFLTRK
jgi:3-oxoadipate enol-lactonase